MGGIPANHHGEALAPKQGDPDAVVRGLMALGEAACVSVQGANRLGTNSLIDLIVFGRAAAPRCAETIKPGEAQPDLPKGPANPPWQGLTASAMPAVGRRPRSCAARLQAMEEICEVLPVRRSAG